MMWYPSGYYATSEVAYNFYKVLYHLLPAYLLDFASLLVGKRRRWVR